MLNRTGTVCLAIVCWASSLSAQSTFGTIVGTVRDASAAVVAKAAVRITNTDENTSRSAFTNDKGDYEILNLKPGHYSVAVSHPGFDTADLSNINLLARQTVRVDVSLKVGSLGQAVTVEASVGVVASETNTIASSYGGERILSLPTNLRASTSTSPYATITTLPGVQSDDGGSLKIQGAWPNQSESSIDGISAQDVRNNRPLREIFPSVESIAEMKGVGNNAGGANGSENSPPPLGHLVRLRAAVPAQPDSSRLADLRHPHFPGRVPVHDQPRRRHRGHRRRHGRHPQRAADFWS